MPDIDHLRRATRSLIRAFTRRVPVRGRHRLVGAIAAHLGADEETVDFGSLRIMIKHDLATSRCIYYGVYEEHLVNWIRRTLRPGDRVIEPGMNVGFISSQILNAVLPGGLLISLEPATTCCARLAADNDLSTKVGFVMINGALSRATGTDDFLETPEIVSAGFGFLDSAGQPAEARRFATRYRVTTHCVDDLMSQFGIERVRFLKLDIEGSELAALEGASRALEGGKIDFILIETNIEPGGREQSSNARIISVLNQSGFRPHRLTRSGELRTFDIDTWMRGSVPIRLDVMWVRAGVYRP